MFLVVVMYNSDSGGCCDCGDKDAWKEEGYVQSHGLLVDMGQLILGSLLEILM